MGGSSIADADFNARKAYSDYVSSNGMQIDQCYVRRGFVSIASEIDLMEQAYGSGSYDLYLKINSDENSLNAYRRHEGLAWEKIKNFHFDEGLEFDDLWNEILHDRGLPSFSKEALLSQLSRSKFEDFLLPYIEDVAQSYVTEKTKICKTYLNSVSCLSGLEAKKIRKNVWNSVGEDVFGRLGFTVDRKSGGLFVFAKKISDRRAVFIECDKKSIAMDFNRDRGLFTYWPVLKIDVFSYLCSTRGNDSGKVMTFSRRGCLAANRMALYDDNQSLEVAVRANALWYELVTARFEDMLR